MSEQKTKLPVIPGTDLTEKDMEALNKFIEDGLPGYNQLTEQNVITMTKHYMTGKTYAHISMQMNLKRELVLYASQKFHWLEMKKKAIDMMEESLESRMDFTKLRTKHGLLDALDVYLEEIEKAVAAYYRTGNGFAFRNAVSLKDVQGILKLKADIFGLPNPEPPAPSPIGLNVGSGVEINKNDKGGVDITPKQTDISSTLAAMAEAKRNAEKAEKEAEKIKTSDIQDKNSNSEGET